MINNHGINVYIYYHPRSESCFDDIEARKESEKVANVGNQTWIAQAESPGFDT